MQALDAVKVCRFLNDDELLRLGRWAKETHHSQRDAAEAINRLRNLRAEESKGDFATLDAVDPGLRQKLARRAPPNWRSELAAWAGDREGRDDLLQALDAVKVCRFFSDDELLKLVGWAKGAYASLREAAEAINQLRNLGADEATSDAATVDALDPGLRQKLARQRPAARGQTAIQNSNAVPPRGGNGAGTASRPAAMIGHKDGGSAMHEPQDDWSTTVLADETNWRRRTRHSPDATVPAPIQNFDAFLPLVNCMRAEAAPLAAAAAGEDEGPSPVKTQEGLGPTAPPEVAINTPPRTSRRTAWAFNASIAFVRKTRTSDLPKAMPGVAGFACPKSVAEVTAKRPEPSAAECKARAGELLSRTETTLNPDAPSLPRPISIHSPRLGDRLRQWTGRGFSRGTKLKLQMEKSFAELTKADQGWNEGSRTNARPETILARIRQARRTCAGIAATTGPVRAAAIEEAAQSLDFASTFELHAESLQLRAIKQRHDLLKMRLQQCIDQIAESAGNGKRSLEVSLRNTLLRRDQILAQSRQIYTAGQPIDSDAVHDLSEDLVACRDAESALVSDLARLTMDDQGVEPGLSNLLAQLVQAHGRLVDELVVLTVDDFEAESAILELSSSPGRHLVGLRSSTVRDASDADWSRLEVSLRTAWERLCAGGPAETQERAMPKALQMQVLNEALQIGCASSPARVEASLTKIMADTLQTLLRCTPEQLLAVTEADGVRPPVDSGLSACMGLLSSVPRGVETACTLVEHGPRAEQARYLEHAAVFWRAQAALNELGDKEQQNQDRAFLQGAREAARIQGLAACNGQAAMLSDRSAKIAYHAVRNGLLSVAPGSSFDLIDQQLMETAVQLKAPVNVSAPSLVLDPPQPCRFRPRFMPPVNAKNLEHLNDLLAAGGKSALSLEPSEAGSNGHLLGALIRQTGPREKYFLTTKSSFDFTVPAVGIGPRQGVASVYVVPMAGAGCHWSSAAALGLESPSWGFSIQASKGSERALGIGRTSLNVGAGFGGIGRGFGTVGVKPVQQTTSHSVSTEIRFIRGKNEAGLWLSDELNQKVEHVLNELMSWNVGDGDGRTYKDGALAKVLLADDGVAVVQSVRDSTRRASSLGIGGGVSSRMGSTAPGNEFAASFGLQANRGWERRIETREEEGHTGLAARETASHSASQWTFSLGPAGAGFGNSGEYVSEGRIRAPVPLGALSVDWSPIDNARKVGAVQFPIGERRGGSLDRIESSPERLIAELKGNSEAWLLRAMDVLPRAVGAEPVPTDHQKLHAAEHMLKHFIEALKLTPQQTVQYGIKYELNPALTGWVDGLEALRNLGTRSGNNELSERAVGAASALLHSHVAWMPKSLSARPAGSVSTGHQFGYLVHYRGTVESTSANFSHINFPR